MSPLARTMASPPPPPCRVSLRPAVRARVRPAVAPRGEVHFTPRQIAGTGPGEGGKASGWECSQPSGQRVTGQETEIDRAVSRPEATGGRRKRHTLPQTVLVGSARNTPGFLSPRGRLWGGCGICGRVEDTVSENPIQGARIGAADSVAVMEVTWAVQARCRNGPSKATGPARRPSPQSTPADTPHQCPTG